MAKRLQRATGTRTALDVLRTSFRVPRGGAADIAAVQRGEGRAVACFFRGLFGDYPRRFTNVGWLDLAAHEMRWHPAWFQFWSRAWPVGEPVTSAYLRPRDQRTDHSFLGDGPYAADGVMGWRGFSVVVYETPTGVLELAVPNPDTALMLAYPGFDLPRNKAAGTG